VIPRCTSLAYCKCNVALLELLTRYKLCLSPRYAFLPAVFRGCLDLNSVTYTSKQVNMKSSIVGTVLVLAGIATARSESNIRPFGQRTIPLPPPEDGYFGSSFARVAPTNASGTAFFDQFLDHNNPSKGTFKQQYWWNATNWAGCVFLLILLSISNLVLILILQTAKILQLSFSLLEK